MKKKVKCILIWPHQNQRSKLYKHVVSSANLTWTYTWDRHSLQRAKKNKNKKTQTSPL